VSVKIDPEEADEVVLLGKRSLTLPTWVSNNDEHYRHSGLLLGFR